MVLDGVKVVLWYYYKTGSYISIQYEDNFSIIFVNFSVDGAITIHTPLWYGTGVCMDAGE